MANPLLNWRRFLDWTIIDGTELDFLEAVSDALPDANYWSAGDSASNYLELVNDGANIPGFRVLIGADSASSPNISQICAPQNNGSGIIYGGIAPDNVDIANGWTLSTASNPYGAARFSKFWRMFLPKPNDWTSPTIRIAGFENEEQILIAINDFSNDQVFPFKAGAILRPIDDTGSGEANGRIYGMASIGTRWRLDNNFWRMSGSNSNYGSWLDAFQQDNVYNDGSVMMGVFLPMAPGEFERVIRIHETINVSAIGLKDKESRGKLIKPSYRRIGGDGRFVGDARAFYATSNAPCNRPLIDENNAVVGYTLAGSTVSAVHAVALTDIG